MGTLINDREKCFIDGIAREVASLAGTEAIIYQFDEVNSQRDWVYDEAVTNTFKTNKKGIEGIPCNVLMKDPDRSPISGEEGFRLDKNSTVSVARKDLDILGLRKPRVGDIWFIWGAYFDVTDANGSDGRFADSGLVFNYDVTIVRRTKAVPEGLWFNRT